MGDLFSPRPAWRMGTSPPSGHADELTDKAGRGAAFPGAPPLAPAGPCAITSAQDDKTTVVITAKCLTFFIMFSSLGEIAHHCSLYTTSALEHELRRELHD